MPSRLCGWDLGTNVQSCAPLTRWEGKAHLEALLPGECAASLPVAPVCLGCLSG